MLAKTEKPIRPTSFLVPISKNHQNPEFFHHQYQQENQQTKRSMLHLPYPHISNRPFSQNSRNPDKQIIEQNKNIKISDYEEADDDGDWEMLTCGSCCPCRPGTCPRRKHRRRRGKWPRRWVPCWGSFGRTGPAGTLPEAARLGGSACPSRSPCLASSLSLPPSSLVSLFVEFGREWKYGSSEQLNGWRLEKKLRRKCS